jgi:hypothetical protein
MSRLVDAKQKAQTDRQTQDQKLGKKKNMCVSDRPTDPNIFYAKKNKKIDRQNPEIRLRVRVCFRIQQ